MFRSKVKFRQTNNHCKRVTEAAKLAYANKTKSNTSQKRGSWQIANSVLNKGKSAISSLFNDPEVLPSAYDKEKLLAKNFFENCDLNPLSANPTEWSNTHKPFYENGI